VPRFAANLSMLYSEHGFLDRFEAAAADGFKGVEFLFPYAWEPSQLRARLQGCGLEQVLFNAPPAGADQDAIACAWDRGDRGLACAPGREAEFRAGFAFALRYALTLECPRVHVMAGLMPPDARPHEARATYIANLQWAARQARPQGLRLMIEPINSRDMPGYFLNRQDQAHALLADIGEDNVQVQMDLYHCQVSEGDVATKIRQYLPTGRVGHFQVAGVPGRHEPDKGELNAAYLFEVIDEVASACGWDGWVGAEYRPAGGAVPGATSAGLAWLRRARAAQGG